MSAAALIDDALLLRLVRGDPPTALSSASLCSTTGYWFRLARAASAPASAGRFSRALARASASDRAALLRQIEALDDLVRFADVRELVASMALVASRHRLNWLAAEVITAALVFDARIVAARGNVGPRLRAAAAAFDLDLVETP